MGPFCSRKKVTKFLFKETLSLPNAGLPSTDQQLVVVGEVKKFLYGPSPFSLICSLLLKDLSFIFITETGSGDNKLLLKDLSFIFITETGSGDNKQVKVSNDQEKA